MLEALVAPDARIASRAFFDPLPACDAVVASLSLHHVDALDRKAPGGVLVTLDATVSADPRLSERTFARWADAMAEHGIDAALAHGHFQSWSKEDRYFPIADELAAPGRAGFAHPEYFWRRGR